MAYAPKPIIWQDELIPAGEWTRPAGMPNGTVIDLFANGFLTDVQPIDFEVNEDVPDDEWQAILSEYKTFRAHRCPDCVRDA